MSNTQDPHLEVPPVPEGNVWSVGQLNVEIESVLDEAQKRLPSYVVGEVSDISQYDFGTFFDLRDLDDDTTISCILWAHQREAITHRLEEGTETIVRARVDFYQDDGRTQLAVKNFWPVGKSDRSENLTALRAELSADGLLDETAAKPLPEYPRHIGVATSLAGSARHDFQQAVRARHTTVPITVCDATVQGKGAITSLVTAVQRLEQDTTIDAIVVTRGGGADADLWCFNEEPVVRAIVDCATPTVVAVGHEDDETLAEAVADHRAMTPTDAGVAVAPDIASVRQHVAGVERRIDRAYTTVVTDRIAALTQQLDTGLQMLEQRAQTREATWQRIADLEHRITVAYEALATSRLTAIESRLKDAHQAIEHAAETDAVASQAAQGRIQGLESRIDMAYATVVTDRVGALTKRIDAGFQIVEQRAQTREATQQRTADLEHRITVAYEAVVRSQLTTIETRLSDAHQAIEHAAETDEITSQAARGRIQGLESRINTAYQTRVDRELNTLELQIKDGYREVETNVRVQASQSKVQRLRIATLVLLVVLGIVLLAVAVGIL